MTSGSNLDGSNWSGQYVDVSKRFMQLHTAVCADGYEHAYPVIDVVAVDGVVDQIQAGAIVKGEGPEGVRLTGWDG